MSHEQDLQRIARQEERLRFQRFDADTAWKIGTRLRALAETRRLKVTIDIQVHGQPIFFTTLPGTSPEQLDWCRRKRNVALLFYRCSYALGLQMRQGKTNLAEQFGLAPRDYASNGGCFPINLHGTGCIGTITVSGLPERLDHGLIVEVLAEHLEQPLAELALPDEPEAAK